MKKLFFSIMLTLGLVSFANASGGSSEEMEHLAEGAIKAVVEDKVDADKMMANMDKLLMIAVNECKELAEHGKGVKYMNLIVANAEKMKTMTLDEIEEAWHDGEILKANGINLDDFGHYSPIINAGSAAVHAATSYIIFKEYKKTGDKESLDAIKDELGHILEHKDEGDKH